MSTVGPFVVGLIVGLIAGAATAVFMMDWIEAERRRAREGEDSK